ncbi:TPA: lipopolysaccharide core heptose(II) kinase RfaY [Kluyvera georgiana]|nr:lipopolysaccharide core heptose(II) kinase RfaY [Kluyvera georgiana]
MITKTKLCNFKLYYKDNEEKYKSIFADVVNYRFRTLKVFRNTNDTKVSLIDTEYGKYILKIFSPKTRKTERFLKSFIKGDYYKHLIVKTDRAKKMGLVFPNDIYFLAERKIFNYSGIFIMLNEYVEGEMLCDYAIIPDAFKNEIKKSIDKLHSLNLLSGDPHSGNFVVTKEGIRLIDLTGKRCTPERKARDRISLEENLGIPNEIKNFSYYHAIFKKCIRKFIRRKR